jgi:hypothetical protein
MPGGTQNLPAETTYGNLISTTHSIKWLKLKRLTISTIIGEKAEDLEILHIAGEN